MIQLHHGDALDVLRGMAPGSVDAVVTDPPAGIGFMGKEWNTPGALVERKADTSVAWDRVAGNHHPENDADRQRTRVVERRRFVAFLAPVLAECLRVAKPGARMFCWAIPRTCGWTQTAIEDAGWLVENCAVHLFATGFPKGKGQLKPAAEFWFLARKPGGKVPPLNVDACRVNGNVDEMRGRSGVAARPNQVLGAGIRNPTDEIWQPSTAGRWPPNVLLSHADGCKRVGAKQVRATAPHGPNAGNGALGALNDDGWEPTARAPQEYGADGFETVAAWECVDGCPVRALDEQSGERHTIKPEHAAMGYGGGNGSSRTVIGDTGTASRFFPQFDEALFLYAAKASRAERNEGCDGMPEKRTRWQEESAGTLSRGKNPRTGERTANVITPAANHHPTVKSQALMRWLCRLITPPGGIVLDPFMGSGSTGVACVADGFGFVGIEREAEYHAIATARIEAARREPEQLALGGAA